MKLRFCPLLPLSLLAIACGNVPNASEVIASPTLDASLPSDCMALKRCCPTLPSEVTASCAQLAAQASQAICAEEVADLQITGDCLTSPTTVKDASMDVSLQPADGGSSRVACTLLSPCCMSSELTNDMRANCNATAASGTEAQCSELVETLTAGELCQTSAPVVLPTMGCAALAQCCGNGALPSSDTNNCDAVASGGDENGCMQLYDTLAPAGYCGAGATLPDGGHLLTSGCMMLSMCCGGIGFPQSTLSTCDMIASANNDGTCLSAYDSYSALSYCE